MSYYDEFVMEFGEELTIQMFEDYYDKNEVKFSYNKLSDGMKNGLFSPYDTFVSTIDDVVEVIFSVEGFKYYAIIRDGYVVGPDVLDWGLLDD